MTPTRRFKAATMALVVTSLLVNSGGSAEGGTPPTEAEVYRAPWKPLPSSDGGPGGLVGVLWFPGTAAEAEESDLRASKTLSLASARCVELAIVSPERLALRETFEMPHSGSGVVLVDERNAVIARVVPSGPTAPIGPVETMVQAEIDRREIEAKAALATANEKIKQKDLRAAEALLTRVWDQRCMFPELAKKAAKALKKIGHPVSAGNLPGGDGRTSGRGAGAYR